MEISTSFKILSHASMLIKRGNVALVIDPWLIGSCYWRSWWNYPEPQIDENQLKEVTHVLISHIHWDHWHGASLKKYFRGRKFLIPDEPRTRSYDDLVRLRLGSVNLLKHGKTYVLENDFKITVYQFGLFFNDAAIVIETPEVIILNANDAKIAGASLKQIIKKHKRFDFAMRSHSTANWRSCVAIENELSSHQDDNEHYSRAFKLFMDAVEPKYAVPFASNHCHLHKDTYHFNENITNPIKLKNLLEHQGGLQSSKLVIMLPGSTWDSQQGFTIRDTEPFDNLTHKLEQYREKNLDILNKYYELESKQILKAGIISKHEDHLRFIPWFLRLRLKNLLIAYRIVKDNGQDTYFVVDCKNCKLNEVDKAKYQQAEIKIEWPILVFRQTISLNMYIHAFISKRIKFYVNDRKHLKQLNRYTMYLVQIEQEVFPIRLRYMWRFFKSYCRRWREIIVYVNVLKEVLGGTKSMPLIEEIMLSKSKQ